MIDRSVHFDDFPIKVYFDEISYSQQLAVLDFWSFETSRYDHCKTKIIPFVKAQNVQEAKVIVQLNSDVIQLIEFDDKKFIRPSLHGDIEVQYFIVNGSSFCVVNLMGKGIKHPSTSKIVHGVGHCLGLLDDPPSQDNESIMSEPIPHRYHLTKNDACLVRDLIEGKN